MAHFEPKKNCIFKDDGVEGPVLINDMQTPSKKTVDFYV